MPVLCCAVLCCAVLCCAVLCCAVLCCAVLSLCLCLCLQVKWVLPQRPGLGKEKDKESFAHPFMVHAHALHMHSARMVRHGNNALRTIMVSHSTAQISSAQHSSAQEKHVYVYSQ